MNPIKGIESNFSIFLTFLALSPNPIKGIERGGRSDRWPGGKPGIP